LKGGEERGGGEWIGVRGRKEWGECEWDGGLNGLGGGKVGERG